MLHQSGSDAPTSHCVHTVYVTMHIDAQLFAATQSTGTHPLQPEQIGQALVACTQLAGTEGAKHHDSSYFCKN